MKLYIFLFDNQRLGAGDFYKFEYRLQPVKILMGNLSFLFAVFAICIDGFSATASILALTVEYFVFGFFDQ